MLHIFLRTRLLSSGQCHWTQAKPFFNSWILLICGCLLWFCKPTMCMDWTHVAYPTRLVALATGRKPNPFFNSWILLICGCLLWFCKPTMCMEYIAVAQPRLLNIEFHFTTKYMPKRQGSTSIFFFVGT